MVGIKQASEHNEHDILGGTTLVQNNVIAVKYLYKEHWDKIERIAWENETTQ
jgi:hypothetical protein